MMYHILYNIKKGAHQMTETAEKRKNIYSGSISYRRLWETLERRGVKKADLKDKEKFNLSPTLVNRLVKNQNVSVDTIMYLCDRLNCQPCDILEYIK
jgi:DNA-binding Xre family transcriptional regulator